MKVLLASSEVLPFSKTGGLADMVSAMARALARAGHEVFLASPLYRGLQDRFPLRAAFDGWSIPMGEREVPAAWWLTDLAPGLKAYLLQNAGYFDRANLYQQNGDGYPDNAERFLFFSKCVAGLAKALPSVPDVVHLHDWQTGLVPLFLRAGQGANPRIVFTIHNLSYQGQFGPEAFHLTNLAWDYFNPEGVEFYGGLNCLKAGILYSDAVTTVSPRYAKEIVTAEAGFGMDGVLRSRNGHLFGVLNGADYDEWKTVDNPHLKHAYTVDDIRGKAAEKLSLQRDLGLVVNEGTPLFGNISRLVDQKGSDILLGAMEEMLPTGLQFALLGTGLPWLEKAFLDLESRYPNQVAVQIGYDAALAHRIEAASDFFVMPSRFEPCGLNQLYSLRYGAIPIVRNTGGLSDSIVDASENPEQATGIKFEELSPQALSQGIRKALVLFQHPDVLHFYRHNGMTKDFSWDRTVKSYLEIYANSPK